MPPFPRSPEEEDTLRQILEPDQLASIGIAPGPNARRKNPALTPEEESEVVAGIDEGRDVGGLEMAANILDIPGAVVRNTLAGKNPLTPLIHPISGQDRITGRDLLEQHGLVDPNVDQGWTPDAGDLAGFGADVLLDPLNLFGGFGAYIKGASKATATAKTLGEGIRAGERALLGVKAHPFTRASKWGIGTGERAAKFADMLGGVGKAIGDSYPGRYAKSILNARYMNTISKEAQPHAADLFDEFVGMEADTRGQIAKYMNELMDAGVITPDDIKNKDFSKAKEWGRRYRDEFEMGGRPPPWAPPHPDPMDPLMQRIHDEQKVRIKNLQNDARLNAVIAPDLDERLTKIDYHPRGISGEDPLSPREMVFGARDLASHGREPWLKGVAGATGSLEDMISDPDVAATAKQWAGNRNAGKEIGDVIYRKYGHEFMGDNPLGQAHEIGGMVNRMDPAIRSIGGYGNFPFIDFMSHELSRRRATAAAGKVIDMIDEHGRELSSFQRGEPSHSIVDILNTVGMHPGGPDTYGALSILAQRRGLNMTDKNVINQLQGLRVPKDLGKDMIRIFETIRGPQNINDVMKAYDSVTNLTKAYLLAHPARYNRDRATGFIQNLATGNTSYNAEKMWYAMRQGKDIPGASKIPKLVEMMTERKIPINDANATKMMREVAFAHQPISAAETTFGGIPRPPGGVEEILGEMPGLIPFDYTDMFRSGDSWNPLEVRGVLSRKTGELRDYTRNRVVAGLEHWGYGYDTANRMPPFFKNMMEGMDPADAKKLTDELQVSYNPRGYSEFEKKFMKRAFPFYSFTSRMLPRILKELANNPAGPIAQMVRRANVFRGDREGDPIPEHLKESLAIGLGELPDGSKRYLAGLGLMHEDPLSLISSNPQDMALELLSRVNPFPKVLIEQAFNQSTFQRGPEGGRPLDELDPPIGRTLSNIAGMMGIEGFGGKEGDPKRLSPGGLIEHIASNSPISRVLSSARTATDPRKEWWAKLLNLGSGVRIYDASEGAMDATLRKLLEQAEKKTGARSYTKVYFSKDQLEKMDPEERKAADRMRSLSKMLDVRAKKRRQEKEKEKENAA